MRLFIFVFLLLHSFLYALELEQCQHFLLRTSFGVEENSLSKCMDVKSYPEYVKESLNTALLTLKEEPLKIEFAHRDKERPRKEFREKLNKERSKFYAWYIKKLLTTPQPLREKMTLFWHNHFTSSMQKVKQAKLMYEQNRLYREYALGNFKDFVHQIIRNPAMLTYLDNVRNKKSHPNENLARELLELFTLGEGHYSEKEIKALARGLTGYSLNRKKGFRFKKGLHDRGEKIFFGTKGNFDADDMIDTLFKQEQLSIFITQKLYKEFISYEINHQEVKRLAKVFRDAEYEIVPLLYALFTSDDFLDTKNHKKMIKSPIELTIGTLRSFQYQNFDDKLLLRYLARMEQRFLNPPNVKGFQGQMEWINVNTLLLRKEFLSRLSQEKDLYATSLSKEVLKQVLSDKRLQIAHQLDKKAYIKRLLLDETYQLK
ncbi:MAG: DUF1800 domain-containing protein [Campylobacterota bacterium]|nr:DUF1800 domain-containing protein [Campylobacterota bacterium]